MCFWFSSYSLVVCPAATGELAFADSEAARGPSCECPRGLGLAQFIETPLQNIKRPLMSTDLERAPDQARHGGRHSSARRLPDLPQIFRNSTSGSDAPRRIYGSLEHSRVTNPSHEQIRSFLASSPGWSRRPRCGTSAPGITVDSEGGTPGDLESGLHNLKGDLAKLCDIAKRRVLRSRCSSCARTAGMCLAAPRRAQRRARRSPDQICDPRDVVCNRPKARFRR